jgi:hypothetical protein
VIISYKTKITYIFVPYILKIVLRIKTKFLAILRIEKVVKLIKLAGEIGYGIILAFNIEVQDAALLLREQKLTIQINSGSNDLPLLTLL